MVGHIMTWALSEPGQGLKAIHDATEGQNFGKDKDAGMDEDSGSW